MSIKKTLTKKTLLFLLAVIAVSAVGVTRDYEFMLPMGLLMVSLFGAVISVLVGLITRKYAAARRFGLLIAVSFLAIIVDIAISERQVVATKKTADLVIASIERYRSAHGALPESLDQLVPEQLPRVPTARYGSFMYQADSHDFTLGFPIELFMVDTYDSKTKQWSRRD